MTRHPLLDRHRAVSEAFGIAPIEATRPGSGIGAALFDATLGTLTRSLHVSASESRLELEHVRTRIETAVRERLVQHEHAAIELREAGELSKLRVLSAQQELAIRQMLAEAEARKAHASASRDEELADVLGAISEVLRSLAGRG